MHQVSRRKHYHSTQSYIPLIDFYSPKTYDTDRYLAYPIPQTYLTLRIRHPFGAPLPAIPVLGALAAAEENVTAIFGKDEDVTLASLGQSEYPSSTRDSLNVRAISS